MANAVKVMLEILKKMGVTPPKKVDEAGAKKAFEGALAEGKSPEDLSKAEVKVLQGLGYEVEVEGEKTEKKDSKKGKKAELTPEGFLTNLFQTKKNASRIFILKGFIKAGGKKVTMKTHLKTAVKTKTLTAKKNDEGKTIYYPVKKKEKDVAKTEKKAKKDKTPEKSEKKGKKSSKKETPAPKKKGKKGSKKSKDEEE